MPELPDLTVYVEALQERLSGSVLEGITLASPFLLRTVSPGVDDLVGLKLVACSRLAKQLVFAFESDYFFVIHLMISGRLQWSETKKLPPKRNGLAAFHFNSGSLIFTEASKKKRASLRILQGQDALAELDPGGLEVLGAGEDAFAVRLRSVNHTLKRSLTDQRIFAGIGNTYSDEILLRGGLSPFKQSSKVSDVEAARLYNACQEVLVEWVERLRTQAKGKFPTKVTAFHDEMVAHGKYNCLGRVRTAGFDPSRSKIGCQGGFASNNHTPIRVTPKNPRLADPIRVARIAGRQQAKQTDRALTVAERGAPDNAERCHQRIALRGERFLEAWIESRRSSTTPRRRNGDHLDRILTRRFGMLYRILRWIVSRDPTVDEAPFDSARRIDEKHDSTIVRGARPVWVGNGFRRRCGSHRFILPAIGDDARSNCSS